MENWARSKTDWERPIEKSYLNLAFFLGLEFYFSHDFRCLKTGNSLWEMPFCSLEACCPFSQGAGSVVQLASRRPRFSAFLWQGFTLTRIHPSRKKAIGRPEGKLPPGRLYPYPESEALCSQEHNIQKRRQSEVNGRVSWSRGSQE